MRLGSGERAAVQNDDPLGVHLPTPGAHLVPYDVAVDADLRQLPSADDMLLVTAEGGDGVEVSLCC